MSAPKRVPDARIAEAIERHHGNLTAAAEELGIARKNLYERLRALGLDPNAYRPGASKVAGIKSKKPRLLVRVLPEHGERLREAKYDLQAKLRCDLDETAVLTTFFEEAFAGWLERKLAAA